VGVYFVDAANEAAEGVKVSAAAISRNGVRILSLVVPPLAPGTYYLRVTTMYTIGGGAVLTAPRSATFPVPLTVEA
jgi:hypothetical protein